MIHITRSFEDIARFMSRGFEQISLNQGESLEKVSPEQSSSKSKISLFGLLSASSNISSDVKIGGWLFVWRNTDSSTILS